jgi:hypothetical protein
MLEKVYRPGTTLGGVIARVRTNTRQKLKRPLRSIKAFDQVAELYHIQLGHRSKANCLALQPAHGHECDARVDLAVPAPINDPRLATVRRQLVRRRPGQQDWLPNLSGSYSLVCGTEQIGQYGMCVHKGLPFVQIVAGETGCRPA